MSLTTPEQGAPNDLAQAGGFADRLNASMQASPWLDAPTHVALASQAQTPEQTVQAGQTVSQAIASTWDGFETSWSDPVLQSTPSLGAGLVQYIHDTIGAPPIDAGTITQLQQALASDGFNIQPTGEWTPSDQQVYNQAVQATKSDQIAGQRPGAVKTSTGLHAFLSHITVTGAFDSIAGYVKSIPNDARRVAGTVAGGATGLAHVITHPSEIVGQSQAEKESIATANRNVQNVLGGHVTQKQEVGAENLGTQLAVLNDALSLYGVTGVLKKAGVDLGANVARGTLEKGSPELLRKPGVISKVLLNGNNDGRVLGSKFVGNQLGLARVGPLVNTFGKDGAYYQAKTLLAQPYRYAAVRAAGQGFSRTQLLGLGLYGDALATSKLPGNTQAQDVLSTHLLDSVDHNITNHGPKVFGWSPLDLNNLMLFLHGPVGIGTEGSASTTVGQSVEAFNNGFQDMLGNKGLPAAFQLATGLSRQDYLDMAGGDSSFLSAYMMSKVQPYAAEWYADRNLGTVLNGADASQVDKLTQLKVDYRALPVEAKTKVVSDMLASDPSKAYLAYRINGDIARSVNNPKVAQAKSLADFKTIYEKAQQIHQAGDLQYLNSPKGEVLARSFPNENAPDFMSARHLTEVNPMSEGDFGWARNETLTSGDVLNKGGIADQYESDLNQALAGGSPLEIAVVSKEINNFLFDNFSLDSHKLDVFGATGNPERGLQILRERAQGLAADAVHAYDMPENTAVRLAEMKALGYKPVIGDHIGDMYIGNLPDIGVNNGWLTGMRKWAGKGGVDPARVPDQDVGRATTAQIQSNTAPIFAELRKNAEVPTYQTPETMLAMLAADGGVQKELKGYEQAIFRLTSKFGNNKAEIAYENSKTGEGLIAAKAALEQKMASGIGLRDVSRKALDEALATTHTVQDASGAQWEWQGITDAASRAKLIQGINDGYRLPGYIMGWQMLENWARSGYGIGSWLAQRHPDSSLLQNVANWPNRVAQVRNRLRFSVSFVYDMRRFTKQSVKMAAEGVTPVGVPLQHMIDNGDIDTATANFDRLTKPSSIVTDQMDTDRMLAGRSIYGIYSPQWHAVYFLNEKLKAGATDAEAKASYDRAFKYGSGGATSPLERSVNTVFFPFSFEKTLLRNLGGYLLDRPAQALALDLAVDEWRKLDKNAVVGNFVYAHFPLLNELNSLNNAFSHGISPGQLGGINAPIIGSAGGVIKNLDKAASGPSEGQKSAVLLNLLLPQNWGANFNSKNLARYIPVWEQFGKVVSAAVNQGNIAESALYDEVSQTTNAIQLRPTLTPQAQQQYGSREKVKLVGQLQDVLDFNAKQSDDADKIKWPSNSAVPNTDKNSLWGVPISKTSIGQYVQAIYPAYSPSANTQYAEDQQRAEQNYIANITRQDPGKGADMAQFAAMANSTIGKINRDSYSPSDLAAVQNTFHEFARQQGKTDPDWEHLYTTFFAYALGPIRSPNGKGP